MSELTGTTALVTGATAGIGRAIALQLAAEGAEVVVHGRDASRGAETVAEIEAAGGSARFVAANLADPGDITRLAEEAGDVDILVNNAGIYAFGPTVDTTVEVFDQHFAINTRAPYLLVAALAPKMAERGHGNIVNVSTVAATTAMASGGVYGASKAAIELLTKTWADEFGAAGVRVNAVAPGPVVTLGTSGMGEVIHAIGRTTIAGRVAEPSEIADAVVFLASSRATYINGTTLAVNGGAPALVPAA